MSEAQMLQRLADLHEELVWRQEQIDCMKAEVRELL